ncbi:MAG: MerR family transcriptional regulator [Ignavibacteriota bacterium]|jgi:DNA-binding transcriptional MerR regulator|nr:MAG: MerR family transcriptional regulator [Ignavibacterium sp.]MBL1154465.1 MerR family transcriptional regulator [Ignavibacteriota bacterium]MCO6448498.1 MerR family transcriptional regulator [Ignavibacterium album]MCZ2268066.1 MerR family transcriptional regulator [Ignavibacteriales bacterium]MDX9712632.1 MerR family transcriptional regulator [Ignavibacteriaceae bacterium]
MKDLSIKKLYYSISEVSKITNIEQYVLRYWETEFVQLKPQKNRAGNRIYTNKDIQLILHIKTLLRERKYTIEGAKKIMENYSPEKILQPVEQIKPISESEASENVEVKKERNTIQKDLEEIKNILEILVSKL